MVLKGKVGQYERDQAALTRQNKELQDRAAKLDQEHGELVKTVGEWQRQSKAYEDRATQLQNELRAMNEQLVRAKSDKDNTDKKVQTLTASMNRQGGVTITPNNSFLQTLPAINLPDVYVKHDGDVIRVELPGDRLFEPGGNQLKPGGAELIAAAANEVLRTYPDQMIAVEGHTDNEPAAGGKWRNNRDLSIARAMAFYDVLITRNRMDDKQLNVVGHGENRPVFSNNTSEGKQRNRRVELVIYPDRRPGK
jgi:chemotaxis protein MotB